MSDSNQIFNTLKVSSKKRPSKKVIIIIASTVVLLAAAGGAAYAFRSQLFGEQQTDTAKSPQGGGDIDEEALAKTNAAANTYAASGNTAGAAQVIDDAIERTSSSDQKAELFSSKASVLAGSDAPAAIKAAEQAVELNPNFVNTAFLAQLYEANGDKQKAIEYYQKTVDLSKKMSLNGEAATSSVSFYQVRLDRLRGQQ